MTSLLLNLVSGLIGAILGSIATFFGNIQLERIKTRTSTHEKKTNLMLSIRLEIEACIKALDEIKSTLNDKGYYPLRWTAVLKKSIQNLEDQRSDFYLLADALRQEKLFQLITDMSLFAADIEGIEAIWNGLHETPPKRPNGSTITDPAEQSGLIEHFKEQRRLKLVELVDLKRRLDEAAKDLA